MTDDALRDHSREMLLAVAQDMETRETEAERKSKSKGEGQPDSGIDTAAGVHGALRHTAGFGLSQLVAEFRAMRASVLSLWARSADPNVGPDAIDELTRFNEGIDAALAESIERYAAELAASREMFLAVLGHDLRGPLSVIAMSSASLRHARLPDSARERAAERIDRAARHMERLITDLLDYTRSRLGTGIPIERAAFDLGPVCQHAIDDARASHPHHTFVWQGDGDLRIDADVERVGQVLSNLLANAVQYGDRTAPISLGAQGEDDAVSLRVTNFGRPIPPELRESIFEPLVQAPNPAPESSARAGTSLGLGLFIVREIVSAHGGTISVESSEAEGTCFVLRLPRTAPERPG
jgi:signal transduction histidine kinase